MFAITYVMGFEKISLFAHSLSAGKTQTKIEMFFLVKNVFLHVIILEILNYPFIKTPLFKTNNKFINFVWQKSLSKNSSPV